MIKSIYLRTLRKLQSKWRKLTNLRKNHSQLGRKGYVWSISPILLRNWMYQQSVLRIWARITYWKDLKKKLLRVCVCASSLFWFLYAKRILLQTKCVRQVFSKCSRCIQNMIHDIVMQFGMERVYFFSELSSYRLHSIQICNCTTLTKILIHLLVQNDTNETQVPVFFFHEVFTFFIVITFFRVIYLCWFLFLSLCFIHELEAGKKC